MLAKEWVVSRDELGRGTVIVAIVASTRVDQITPQSHQRPVFAFQIQGDGRDVKPPLNSNVIVIVLSVICLASHGARHHRGKCYSNESQSHCKRSAYSCSHVLSFRFPSVKTDRPWGTQNDLEGICRVFCAVHFVESTQNSAFRNWPAGTRVRRI